VVAALECVTDKEIMIVCASHWPALPAAAALLQNRFGVSPADAALHSFNALGAAAAAQAGPPGLMPKP
jgi:hypothetical protein